MQKNPAKAFGFLSEIGRIQKIALIIALILTTAAPIRWRFQVRNQDYLSSLYVTASGGDLAGVAKLSEMEPGKSSSLLKVLAADRRALAVSRVEAINLLVAKGRADSRTLAPLLRITEPPLIRHASALVLIHQGCDFECVSEVLKALYELNEGHPTFEMLLPPIRGGSEIRSEIRLESIRDYMDLLSRNPCTAKTSLNTLFGSDADAGAFVADLAPKLPPLSRP